MADEIVIGEAGATGLQILSASAVRQAITACATLFREQRGESARAQFDTSGAILKRLRAGEQPDIVASSRESLEELAAAGLLGGPPHVVGVSRIALGVRTGDPVPDISTTEALVRVLRAAPVIVRGDPAGGGTAGNHLQKVLERLGLVEELQARTVLRVGGYNVMKEVAEGRAPFGLTQSTEIVAVPGVEIGAWLPDDIQLTTHYAVARGPATGLMGKAEAFLDFLRQDECRALFDKAGFARP
jgi:molybdate transport system substrate-binding protein